MTEAAPPARVRREPPRFRRAVVVSVQRLTPRMVRLRLAGPDLDGFAVHEPAASVRLLVPPDGGDELVMPRWHRNIFLLPDGRRAPIRTFTPLRTDPVAGTLELEIVLHGSGVASTWAASAAPGALVALSGPARGYTIDPSAPGYLLAGDESALPALSQLLGVLPVDTPVQVVVEVADRAAEQPLAVPGTAAVRWLVAPPGAVPGALLAESVERADLLPGTRVWVAGEAAAVQRVRRHLFDERGLTRTEATVRGYWKFGRGGDDEE